MAYDVQDFAAEVIERSRRVPVLVDFWAEWCGPCRALGPVLERLAEEEAAYAEPRWRLAKVNTEVHTQDAAEYGVRSIPNVKLFVDGEVADEFTGALPEPMVRSWLEKALPDPNRELIARARTDLQAGNVAGGRALLESVLESESGNREAAVVLAESWLTEDPARAEELVRGIREDSDQFDRAEAVRTFAALARAVNEPDSLPEDPVRNVYIDAARAALGGDYDRALEGFIRVIRENRYYAEDGARRSCLAIFRLLGESHQITRRHRRAFDGALYV